MADILKMFKNFCNNEIKSAKRSLDPSNPYKWNKKDIINNTIQRCLGVAFFIQEFDNMSYNDIDKIYENTRIQLYDLLKERG